MDDFVVNVRQIGSYPGASSLGANDLLLIQQNGLGGAYASVTPNSLMQDAMAIGGSIQMKSGYGMEWDGNANQSFHFDGNGFTFSSTINAPGINVTSNAGILINGQIAATQTWVGQQLEAVQTSLDSKVQSFNGRNGDVWLYWTDINAALGITGNNQVASTQWVCDAINNQLNFFYANANLVHSFNGRYGDIILTTSDVNIAYATDAQNGIYPVAPNPTLGDASSRIATTLFVDESLDDLYDRIQTEISQSIDLSPYAPLASPQFSGIPTAPTAAQTSNSGQLATTAFVKAAVTASTTGVASFNTRTGAVTLTTADVTGVGGALLASPTFTGTPAAPTAAPGTNTTQLATTAFVSAAITAIAAGVSSFNTRTGAVTLTTADITGAGGAPINNAALTGVPTAPTAAPATNTTQLATTAYVTSAIAAVGAGVTSFNGRNGAVSLQANDVSAVGGALLAGPAFTGVPSAPTAAPGTNTTQLATTAYVMAQIAASASGVASFNSRTGAVTLTTADITGAGGAPINSPGLTGTPTAPTATTTDSSTAIATTAFVKNAIAANVAVSSFNTRTGAVTFQASDVSAVGGALLNSPTFTGTPSGPTATAGTNTTQFATTAFVTGALNNTVTSFNGRNGVVTLTAADLTAAGGALLASPTFTGTPTAPTPTAGTANTQIATTAFVSSAVSGATAAQTTTWNPSDTTANMTLSNGNLTATSTNFSVGTRAVIGLSSGKTYFEISVPNSNSSADAVGLATASAVMNNFGVAGQAIYTAGIPVINGTNQTSMGNPGANAVISVAVDMTAKRLWFRVAPSGSWNAPSGSTNDPATGVGGYDISALTAPLFPIFMVGAATGHAATANFGATPFIGAVPSTYSSGIVNPLDGKVHYDAAQTLTAAQSQQARQNIYAAPFDAFGYFGMQVNGACEVSNERGNTSFAMSSGGAPVYICDGWSSSYLAAGSTLSAFPLNASAPPGYINSLAMQSPSGIPASGASDFVLLQHPIEGIRCGRLAWGSANAMPISIAFWVSAPVTGKLPVTVENGAVNRSYITEVTINTAATWQYVSFTVPGDTAGTWAKDTTTSIYLRFCLAAGSSYKTGSLGTWQAGNLFATSTSTNMLSGASSTVYITGLVVLPGLELPSTARAPLIVRTYDQELLLCQRYLSFPYANARFMASAANQTMETPVAFPIRMRIVPTLGLYSAPSNANMAASFPQYSTTSLLGARFAISSAAAGDCYMLGVTLMADARL